ncbi:MAG TPA: glycosyltransferase family 4 protein, partial [Acidimicrobiales bacterium]|nr:glycosyltransferase family 4 protein [Acidimicrobiales bacterium]
RLPVFPSVFGAAAGLVYHTYGERALVQSLFAVATTPQVVLGLGVDEAAGDPIAARAVAGVGERPYLVCVGRVDDQKGCGALWRSFLAYKRRRPGPLALVLAGQVVDRPPDDPDLFLTGPVDEATKWGLYAGSLGVVSPSAMESFSLLVVEGWTAGVPVIVNGRCPATVEHCRRSAGGLWFDGYAQFEAVLDRFTADADLRGRMADRGRRYVAANFAWPVLIERYRRFCEQVAARAA